MPVPFRSVAMLFVLLVVCIVRGQDPQHALTIRYNNDFFSATDRYLTQDVGFAYQAPFVARLPTAGVLLRLKDAPVTASLFVRQQCYTPSSIRRDTIFTGERPFAAALYAGQEMVSIAEDRGLRLASSIILGVLGPCALCEQEQKGIHEALDNIEPLGWQYQIATAPIVNYSARLDKRMLQLGWVEASGGAGAELGTYRTNALLHARVELGRFRSVFAPITVDRKLRASVEFNAEAKGVAYDATLQGGLGNNADSYELPAEALERVVLRAGWEVRLSYKRVMIAYNKVYLTREFNAGLPHGWGGLSLRWWW